MKFGKQLALATAMSLVASAASALTFNLTFIPGTTLQEQTSFQAAAALWSAKLTDNVTVDLTVGTGALGAGILASANSRAQANTYSQVKSALNADKTSASDNTAVANLTAGANVGMLINYTSNNPNGVGSPIAYVDSTGANTTNMSINTANAKALGLALVNPVGTVGGCLVTCDAFIQFSNAFAYDHNRGDGISGGAFDFVGLAAHEIGHALGFVSGVDELDTRSPQGNSFRPDDVFTFVTTLDLFRWSAASDAADVIDWTAGNSGAFFSIDRGTTVGPLFSTGQVHGDGRQASHWKDGLGLGIMDPTAAAGELLTILGNDLLAMDVIGWNLEPVVINPTPVPPALALVLLGLASMKLAMRRRRPS